MLVFLAADKSRLEELRQAVRDYLAWRSIDAEKETLNLDTFQSKQAETKKCALRRRRRAADRRDLHLGARAITVMLTIRNLLGRDQSNGPDPLAVRVAKKLRNEEALITEYSGARLRMDLDRVPLWRWRPRHAQAAVE